MLVRRVSHSKGSEIARSISLLYGIRMLCSVFLLSFLSLCSIVLIIPIPFSSENAKTLPNPELRTSLKALTSLLPRNFHMCQNSTAGKRRAKKKTPHFTPKQRSNAPGHQRQFPNGTRVESSRAMQSRLPSEWVADPSSSPTPAPTPMP